MVNKQMMHCLSVMADTDGEELTASKDFNIIHIYFYFYFFSAAAVLQEESKNVMMTELFLF